MRELATVASVVREARKRAGLSQRALAERARTAQSVIGRIEAGLSSPSIETLARVLDAAGFELKVELSPKARPDPVIEAYKHDVDRTLLRANLGKSVDERLRVNVEMLLFGNELRRAMRIAEQAE
ncbi:MAG: helix-turn-helix transcriptional regulator [Gemmatimonadota bacterium]